MGLVLDAEESEDGGFSVLWLGLVIVPLDCLVVTVGDEEDDPDRVVSFSSDDLLAAGKRRRLLLASFHDMGKGG